MEKENITEQKDSAILDEVSCEEEIEDEKKELAALKKEIERLEKELEKTEKKAEENAAANKDEHDKYLRIMAEYDNYRKRTTKEREGAYSDAYSDVVKAFLPMYDNLVRSVQFSDSEKMAEGVQKIILQFKDINTKLGVSEFGDVGDPFDPNIHEAVMHVKDDTLGENTVVEVFQKGYKIGEKIIRYAVVKVAN